MSKAGHPLSASAVSHCLAGRELNGMFDSILFGKWPKISLEFIDE